MPEYYFLREELPETPDIDPGYESGLVDEFNPAPKGAVVVESLAELEELQDKANKFIPADPDELDVEPKECPIVVPEGVRWHEPEQGRAVTFAFRNGLSGDDLLFMRQCWEEFRTWAEHDSSIVFEEARSFNSAKVQIGQREIDGRGRVLGEALTRFIERDGKLLFAELWLDSADSLENNTDRLGTHLHEGCHILGIPHSPGNVGLMAATSNSVMDFGDYENKEKFTRYPRQKVS